MGAGGEAGGGQARLTEQLAGFLAASRWQDIPASIRREAKRRVFRRARIGVLLTLLLAVGLWGFLNYRADNFVFA